MDKYIDTRFERLEKALATLIDSVTKYHPSTVQGEELKAADVELTKGLQEGLSYFPFVDSLATFHKLKLTFFCLVQTHQNNHLRIQQLRQSSATLDVQIRDTLTSLATTRKDIVTTQTTTYPSSPNNSIRYEELLNYARRISKTTMPPASAIGGRTSPTPESQTPVTESQPQSALTPSAPTPSLTQSPVAMNGVSQLSSEPQTQQSATNTNISLPEGMSQYLNPLSGQLFFPWPLEDKVRMGALASNQLLAEQGIDPKGYDPVLEEDRKRKEEEDRKEKEEQEAREREEREKKMKEEMERLRKERERQREKEQAAWRRASDVTGGSDPAGPARGGAAPGEKKQFQFTNLDDLDDDDDDD